MRFGGYQDNDNLSFDCSQSSSSSDSLQEVNIGPKVVMNHLEDLSDKSMGQFAREHQEQNKRGHSQGSSGGTGEYTTA